MTDKRQLSLSDRVTLWVCTACGAPWFSVVNNKCPACKGECERKGMRVEPDGRVVAD